MSTTWAIEGFLWEFTHDWKVAEGTEVLFLDALLVLKCNY